MTDKDYSLKAFNRFIDHAVSKRLLKRNTAQSRKAAANKILGVLEPNEIIDLRTVDVDQAFDQFQNLHGMTYNPKSLQVYLSRTRTAISDFVSFVDNPSSFKPSTPQRSSPKGKNEGSTVNHSGNTMSEKGGDSGRTREEHHETKHVIVPVPLRKDLTVKISNLPADLTEAEAEKLAAIVKAYAVSAQ